MFRRHRLRLFRSDWFHRAALPGLVCLLVTTLPRASYSTGPSISLGKGRSKIVEYDAALRPVRTWTGLNQPSDITPLPDGTILVVDQGARRVILLGEAGIPLWSEQIGDSPMRARPRPGGGYLVTSQDSTVVATRPDRTIEWKLPIRNVRTAVPLPNGNILAASNENNGWITELTPDGATTWRSAAHSGQPGAEDTRTLYFASVSGIDVKADGSIFAPIFDGAELRLVAPDRQSARRIPGMTHTTDARVGPHGELVAVSPEAFRVWVERANGRIDTFSPPMRPETANVTPSGNLLVGMTWEPERAAMRASEAAALAARPVAWWMRGMPLPILGTAIALLIALYLRRSALRQLLSKPAILLASADRDDGETRPSVDERPRAPLVTVLTLIIFAVAIYFAWTGIHAVRQRWSAEAAWRFGIGSVAAGIALRFLNFLRRSNASISSFAAANWRPAPASDRHPGAVPLLVFSLFSVVLSATIAVKWPVAEAGAAALWFAGQIFLLAAAWPPQPALPTERGPRWAKAALGLILLAGIVTRFWQIGFYPDFVHHDHVIYGEEVLKTMRGEWTPFFTRIYSVARPAFLPMAAALEIFGHHYWVLRFVSGVAGVVIIWGTYLLGTALLNWRAGLFGALLVMANNVLLLYSRQPYVLDPVAPFVLALYCGVAGLRRGSRWHWCVGGFLGAWALLGYHASVTFVPIAGAWLAFLIVFYPGAMWRRRPQLLWMLAGIVVVYLPMTVVGYVLRTGLDRSGLLVFFNADGSINWDPNMWQHQLGRAFGSLFFFPETIPWVVGTGESICMQYGSVIAAIGFTYLLLTWRLPAAFFLITWTVISIFLGGAALPNPPTFYHTLAAVVAIMLASAVAVDRFLALTDRSGTWRWRIPSQLIAVATLAVVSITNIAAVWVSVQRPAPIDGHQVYTANARIMAGRFIREHPNYRYYLVRSPLNVDTTADNEIFRFFASDSDVSDISNDLGDYLPVPVPRSGLGVGFIVLPARAADRDAIARTYPTATMEELVFEPGNERVWAYLVDVQAARTAYEARRRGSTSASDDDAMAVLGASD